ncbi:tRNA lysidine(34) synthetase TilS [Aureimonas fodinaquatilis]|uniref:tRNA lysidine(34) synthetase TilS n=1 Tax=Aureimonas fodinaquatilis TaxID=2565783 RepID=UPI00165D3257|nr:tRNA lysidine(34) synthetase TilS [Aureimonas fodinaquatilis]
MTTEDFPISAPEAAQLISSTLPRARPGKVVLAVSGGADSTAMMLLAAQCSIPDIQFHVVTIDHGLRAESAAEASYVADLAQRLGLPHDIIRWDGQSSVNNPSAAAREARYRMLTDRARQLEAFAVMTAHHQDDQIETHLLAKDRGAIGAGLAGMRRWRSLFPDIVLARPFLSIPASRFRQTLLLQGINWVEDPSNQNDRYARARLRKHLQSVPRRSDHLHEIAKAAAERAAADAGMAKTIEHLVSRQALIIDDAAQVRLEISAMRELPDDRASELLARMITAAGGALYPPSASAIERVMAGLGAGQVASTLGGCQILADGKYLLLRREYGRLGPEICNLAKGCQTVVFDRRFLIDIQTSAGAKLCSLGFLRRGNAATRCLPVVVDEQMRIVAAHSKVAGRISPLVEILPAHEIVFWRMTADLPEFAKF